MADPASGGAPAVPALTQPATAGAPSIAGQAPAPACAMRAFELLRAALDQAQPLASLDEGTPVAASSPAAGLLPIHGVSVQIRLHGRVIGSASRLTIQRLTRDDESYALVRDAFNEALASALASLRLPNDATRDEVARSLTRDMTLSVDAAGLAVPIEPATWAELAQRVNPGVTGLTSRLGTSDGPRGLFPSDVLATGATTLAALSGHLARQIGEGGAAAVLDEPPALRQKYALQLFTFASTHVAQGLPRSSPVFLARGSRLVDRQNVSLPSLREWTQRAAEHLVRRAEALDQAAKDNPSGIGTYKPWLEQGWGGGGSRGSGGAAAVHGTPGESLLAAIALQRAAATSGTNAPWRGKALAASTKLIDRACAVPASEVQSWDVPTAALLLVAQHGESEDAPTSSRSNHQSHAARLAARAEASAKVWAAFNTQGKPTPGFDRALPETSRGLVALALVIDAERLATRNGDEATKPSVFGPPPGDPMATPRASVRAAFADTPPERLVGQMPWLLWAEQQLARAEHDHKPAAAQPAAAQSAAAQPEAAQPVGVPPPLASAVALRSVRDLCWQFQFDGRDAQPDTLDLVGGIVFTSGRGSPLPTWHSARAGAFLAAAVREPSLTDAKERLDQVSKLLKLAAFLRQLQADEYSAWSAISPEDAIGGVRASTWDHQMPPDATSFTLLTYAELIESIEMLSRTQSPKDTSRP